MNIKLPTRKSDEPKPMAVSLTITTPTFLKIVLLVIATILVLAALRQAAYALLLIGTSIFLALALNSPVNKISSFFPGKLRGNRTLATSVSFLLVVAVLGVFIANLIPPLVKQTQGFISTVPGLVNNVRDENGSFQKLIQRYNLQDEITNASNQVSARLNDITGSAFSTVSSIGSSLFAVLTVLALTFMMLVEGPKWRSLMRSLVPPRHLPVADRLSANMYRVIAGYVNGQVTLAAIAAVVLVPALLFLDISYPIALVFVVFVCGLIPMVGHTIGAGIVTVVALFTSPQAAVFILIYYITYQQIENYFIQPRVQANSTNMSPLLVFGSVVVGVSFSGLLGGLVAIPLAGCIRIAALEYLNSRNLIHDVGVDEDFLAITNDTK